MIDCKTFEKLRRIYLRIVTFGYSDILYEDIEIHRNNAIARQSDRVKVQEALDETVRELTFKQEIIDDLRAKNEFYITRHRGAMAELTGRYEELKRVNEVLVEKLRAKDTKKQLAEKKRGMSPLKAARLKNCVKVLQDLLSEENE